MIHRCDPSIVNQDIEAFLGLPNLREHVFDCRFISDIEAVVPVIRNFPFESRAATPNYLALFARAMLDQGAADAFTRPGN